MLVLNRSSKLLALHYEISKKSPCEKSEYIDDIKYEESNLSGGVGGIDYEILYGLGDGEVKMDEEA